MLEPLFFLIGLAGTAFMLYAFHVMKLLTRTMRILAISGLVLLAVLFGNRIFDASQYGTAPNFFSFTDNANSPRAERGWQGTPSIILELFLLEVGNSDGSPLPASPPPVSPSISPTPSLPPLSPSPSRPAPSPSLTPSPQPSPIPSPSPSPDPYPDRYPDNPNPNNPYPNDPYTPAPPPVEPQPSPTEPEPSPTEPEPPYTPYPTQPRPPRPRPQPIPGWW